MKLTEYWIRSPIFVTRIGSHKSFWMGVKWVTLNDNGYDLDKRKVHISNSLGDFYKLDWNGFGLIFE